MNYREKLLDPRWQKKRLEILQRDEFKCCDCGETSETLHVHHRYYVNGRDPWRYPDFSMVTLCATCHEYERSDNGEDWGPNIVREWEVIAGGLFFAGDRLGWDMAVDIMMRTGDSSFEERKALAEEVISIFRGKSA